MSWRTAKGLSLSVHFSHCDLRSRCILAYLVITSADTVYFSALLRWHRTHGCENVHIDERSDRLYQWHWRKNVVSKPEFRTVEKVNSQDLPWHFFIILQPQRQSIYGVSFEMLGLWLDLHWTRCMCCGGGQRKPQGACLLAAVVSAWPRPLTLPIASPMSRELLLGRTWHTETPILIDHYK